MSFSGYAAVFDSPSEPLPWSETIRAGAFGKSLKSRNNVMMLWSHDTSQPLASTRSKTMQLSEDSKGLLVNADLPNTSLGRDVAELLRSKVVDSMSFGFSVPRNGDVWSADGNSRELVEVRLHEVSVVAFPAYVKTSASVRSLDILADKTGADTAVLSAALDALESGESLTRDQAALLSSVVDTLTPSDEPVLELSTDSDVKVKLSVLKEMLDLTYKSL
jgi:HK97 family phage prohead protease